MQFTKYASIENSYKENYINKIIEQGYGNKEYVVLSKTDGANFSFICNGKQVIQASRNDKVNTDFFNCQLVVDKYAKEVLKLFELINTDSELEQLQLYGELIGDGINNRVKYCSGREFLAFDLLVTYKFPVVNNNKNIIINYDKFKYYLRYTIIPLAPEHFKGNLRDCLDYCNNNLIFNSLIPKLLDNEYKDLEVNKEEGYCIKPIEYLTLKTGDRVILKCKSPEFKESSNKVKTTKVSNLTEEENNILNILNSLITDSRIYSVISKIGQLTTNDFGKVLGLYIKDVIEEFSKDNDVNLVTKTINKQLNKRCADCIRSIWLNLLDNAN